MTPSQLQVFSDAILEVNGKLGAIQQSALNAGNALNPYPSLHTCHTTFREATNGISAIATEAYETMNFILNNVWTNVIKPDLSNDSKLMGLNDFRHAMGPRVRRIAAPKTINQELKDRFEGLDVNEEANFNPQAVINQLTTVQGVFDWIENAYAELNRLAHEAEQKLDQGNITVDDFKEDVKWVATARTDLGQFSETLRGLA